MEADTKIQRIQAEFSVPSKGTGMRGQEAVGGPWGTRGSLGGASVGRTTSSPTVGGFQRPLGGKPDPPATSKRTTGSGSPGGLRGLATEGFLEPGGSRTGWRRRPPRTKQAAWRWGSGRARRSARRCRRLPGQAQSLRGPWPSCSTLSGGRGLCEREGCQNAAFWAPCHPF